jgi:hypothetical protein
VAAPEAGRVTLTGGSPSQRSGLRTRSIFDAVMDERGWRRYSAMDLRSPPRPIPSRHPLCRRPRNGERIGLATPPVLTARGRAVRNAGPFCGIRSSDSDAATCVGTPRTRRATTRVQNLCLRCAMWGHPTSRRTNQRIAVAAKDCAMAVMNNQRRLPKVRRLRRCRSGKSTSDVRSRTMDGVNSIDAQLQELRAAREAKLATGIGRSAHDSLTVTRRRLGIS